MADLFCEHVHLINLRTEARVTPNLYSRSRRCLNRSIAASRFIVE
jgi:hypothetical protein